MTRTHTALLNKNGGFDYLSDLLDSFSAQATKSFPPYNVLALEENKFLLEFALAGFAQDEITVEVISEKLRISADVTEKTKRDQNRHYIHRGIAARNFVREFHLAPYVKVVSAEMENGMLAVVLMRETPEALKPQKIEIKVKSKDESGSAPTDEAV